MEEAIDGVGVAKDFNEIFDERTENALPPPDDSTADAESIYEISSLILFRSDLKSPIVSS